MVLPLVEEDDRRIAAAEEARRIKEAQEKAAEEERRREEAEQAAALKRTATEAALKLAREKAATALMNSIEERTTVAKDQLYSRLYDMSEHYAKILDAPPLEPGPRVKLEPPCSACKSEDCIGEIGNPVCARCKSKGIKCTWSKLFFASEFTLNLTI